MKLNFFILEVVLAQKEMSPEEAKNWKQPTYWEAMTQVGFKIIERETLGSAFLNVMRALV